MTTILGIIPLLTLGPLLKIPKVVVVGFRNVALWYFWAEKGGNFKSFPRVPKLGISP
jgi:hypothetical protein